MIIRLIKVASNQINSELIKFWKDDFDNVLAIFSVAGKKYGFIGRPKENPHSWSVFLGVATEQITSETPVGVAKYIYGEGLSEKNANELTEFFKIQAPRGVRIPNGQGVSWSPKSESQATALIKLVIIFSSINSDLNANGILYPSGDKDLFGEDVTEKHVKDWWSNKLNRPQEVKKDLGQTAEHIFGGLTPNWGPEDAYSNLGKYHADRLKGNWQSDNSIDIFAPAGTPIYSLSSGIVSAIKTYNDGKTIYGTQISVKGIDGHPDLFYTHTDNPAVSEGDQIRVGELIAQVGKPNKPTMPSHLHLGVPEGVSLSSLVSRSGKIQSTGRRISSRSSDSIKKISSRF